MSSEGSAQGSFWVLYPQPLVLFFHSGLFLSPLWCLGQLLGFICRAGMCSELWGTITTSALPGLCTALDLPHTNRGQLCDSPRLQLPINFLESSLIPLIVPPWPSSASFPAVVFACGSFLSPLTSSCPSVFQVSPFLGTSPLSSCSFLLSLALGASLSPPEFQLECECRDEPPAFAPFLPSGDLGQGGEIRALAAGELLVWAVTGSGKTWELWWAGITGNLGYFGHG